jgi:hypothetical protein
MYLEQGAEYMYNHAVMTLTHPFRAAVFACFVVLAFSLLPRFAAAESWYGYYSYESYYYEPAAYYYPPVYYQIAMEPVYSYSVFHSVQPASTWHEGYGYTVNPYNYSIPTGDTDAFGNELCYWEDYGRSSCDFNPHQWIYDPWTGSWY